MANCMLPAAFLLLLALLGGCSHGGTQFKVGDWFWSIPPTNNFYTDWSSTHSFQIGDALYFDFDSGTSNMIQVSRADFERCSGGNQAFEAFMEGPAVVALAQKGVFYFMCNITHNCALGQKVSVIVEDVDQKSMEDSSPSPSPVSTLV